MTLESVAPLSDDRLISLGNRGTQIIPAMPESVEAMPQLHHAAGHDLEEGEGTAGRRQAGYQPA